MSTETLLLVGRETGDARAVYETHADRLRRRGVVDRVRVRTYATDPVAELRELPAGERVIAVPATVAHDPDTIDRLPAALEGAVYGEPIGRSPAVTAAIAARAHSLAAPADDVALFVVAFGSPSTPYHRQVAEYHASRLRDRSAYGAVRACYLHESPTVEAAQYGTTAERIVAVPLYLARSRTTDRQIADALEGAAIADPLGDHPRITDAIQAELATQRLLARDPDAAAEPGARPNGRVATDRPR